MKKAIVLHAIVVLIVFLALFTIAHRTIYGSPTRRQVLANEIIENYRDSSNDIWDLFRR